MTKRKSYFNKAAGTWDEQFKANSIVVMGEALGHQI